MGPGKTLVAVAMLACALAVSRFPGEYGLKAHKKKHHKAKSASAGPHPGYSSVVEKAMPAVVSILESYTAGEKVMKLPTMTIIQHSHETKRSLGSGIIVDASGLVLTNAHVVETEGANLTITDAKGHEFKAKVLLKDKKRDMAMIQIYKRFLPIEEKGKPSKKEVDLADGTSFPFLELADAHDQNVGDIVLAIGNNLGFKNTVTGGVISNIGRLMDESGATASKKKALPSVPAAAVAAFDDTSIIPYIQTDAAVNMGNSGGALVNTDGKLVGMNTMIVSSGGSGNVGLAFALPSNVVKPIILAAKALKPGQSSFSIPSDGVVPENAGPDEGALVKAVLPGSPADKAGLKQGDRIVAINGIPIQRLAFYELAIYGLAIGAEAKYTYVCSSGVRKDATLTIGAKLVKPPEPEKKRLDMSGLGALGQLFGSGKAGTSLEDGEEGEMAPTAGPLPEVPAFDAAGLPELAALRSRAPHRNVSFGRGASKSTRTIVEGSHM